MSDELGHVDPWRWFEANRPTYAAPPGAKAAIQEAFADGKAVGAEDAFRAIAHMPEAALLKLWHKLRDRYDVKSQP